MKKNQPHYDTSQENRLILGLNYNHFEISVIQRIHIFIRRNIKAWTGGKFPVNNLVHLFEFMKCVYRDWDRREYKNGPWIFRNP